MGGTRSRYRTRAVGDAEARAAMSERARRLGGVERTDEADVADRDVSHVLVEDLARGRVVCCYRMTGISGAGEVRRSLAVRFCDPEGLARFEAPLVEIGRFCVEAGMRDPDVQRVAWSALRDHLDRPGIEVLFGGSGVAGARWEPFRDVFALLLAGHPDAPRARGGVGKAVPRPLPKGAARPDVRAALRRMPPLLRTWFGIDDRPGTWRVGAPTTPPEKTRDGRGRAKAGV